MDGKLFLQAVAKFLMGAMGMALLLFLPAGTTGYWNGWLLMGILFIPMLIAGFVMMAKSPELLRKRLNVKEKEPEQKTVIRLSGCMFIAGFIAAGLNFRFQWLTLPSWVSFAAAVVFLLAYALYAEVLRENAYLSRTIEVQTGQRVIDTGVYGVVRHPMYAATLLLFLAMPLVLGSLPSFVLFLLYPAIIAKRIHNEENVLERDLPGYAAYKERVKYKVVPFVW